MARSSVKTKEASSCRASLAIAIFGAALLVGCGGQIEPDPRSHPDAAAATEGSGATDDARPTCHPRAWHIAIGAACSAEGVTCSYACGQIDWRDDLAFEVRCEDGRWVQTWCRNCPGRTLHDDCR